MQPNSSKSFKNARKSSISSLIKCKKKTTVFDKPLPLISFIVHVIVKAFQICEKLKTIRKGPFKIVNKPTDLTLDCSTKDGYISNSLKLFGYIIAERTFSFFLCSIKK